MNEIQKLKSQGIDTSNLIVAEPTIGLRNPRGRRGTLNWTNDWIQTDPSDGKVVIAWSMMEDYPYKDETTKFMAELRTVQIGYELCSVFVKRASILPLIVDFFQNQSFTVPT